MIIKGFDIDEAIINEEDMVKANGNPVDEFTFRLIEGDFLQGETVVVETVLDGKQYTRKVNNDRVDLYIVIKGTRCHLSSDLAW